MRGILLTSAQQLQELLLYVGALTANDGVLLREACHRKERAVQTCGRSEDAASLRHSVVLSAGSYENIMHCTERPAFGLQLTEPNRAIQDEADAEALRVLRSELAGPRLERAIGVIYRPDTERFSHYFKT